MDDWAGFSTENCREGQKYPDGGAALVPLLASQLDRASMPIDNLAADPKAEARSLETFRGKEGVKGFLYGVWRHPRSLVGDGKEDAFPSGDSVAFSCTQKQPATCSAHGINGVCNEIAEDLPYLTFKTTDRTRGTMPLLDRDFGIDDPVLVQRDDLLDQFAAGDFPGAGGLLVKAKSLTRDLCNATQFPIGGNEVFSRIRNLLSSLCKIKKVGH
jgi:hypothetical protein